MAEENLSKSKKSSRRNDKKEEKVELFVDRNWHPLTVFPPPSRSISQSLTSSTSLKPPGSCGE